MGLSSEASDEKTVTFMTPPRINAADEIVAKANVVSGNAVNVSWTSPSSLQCVPDYTASLCGQDGDCNQATVILNPSNHQNPSKQNRSKYQPGWKDARSKYLRSHLTRMRMIIQKLVVRILPIELMRVHLMSPWLPMMGPPSP